MRLYPLIPIRGYIQGVIVLCALTLVIYASSLFQIWKNNRSNVALRRHTPNPTDPRTAHELADLILNRHLNPNVRRRIRVFEGDQAMYFQAGSALAITVPDSSTPFDIASAMHECGHAIDENQNPKNQTSSPKYPSTLDLTLPPVIATCTPGLIPVVPFLYQHAPMVLYTLIFILLISFGAHRSVITSERRAWTHAARFNAEEGFPVPQHVFQQIHHVSLSTYTNPLYIIGVTLQNASKSLHRYLRPRK